MDNTGEIHFMARYIWRTLIGLYDRLNVKDRIQLRNVDSYIEIGPEAAEAFKAALYFGELVEAVKEALRRIQFTMYEEVVPEKYTSGGRVEARLLARYFPSYVPIRRRRLEYAIPANLLLAAVILETRDMALRTLQRLAGQGGNPLYKALVDYVAERFQDIINTRDILLSDPIIRPLLREVRGRRARIEDLEKIVELEYRRRPRLYRPYRRLINYARLLRAKMGAVPSALGELSEKILAMDITPAKIYELYGFTLILEYLLEIFEKRAKRADSLAVKLNKQGKEIVISSEQPKLELVIAYNAIPDDIKSKFEKARIDGLLDGEIKASSIKGLPDTFIMVKENGERKLLVIDYKYSRDISYQINSRFKVYAYLNEYNADVAIVVSPTPILRSLTDEEGRDQADFYTTIAKHQGALIHIDGQGQLLGILYLDPNENSLNNAKEAVKKILNMFLDG